MAFFRCAKSGFSIWGLTPNSFLRPPSQENSTLLHDVFFQAEDRPKGFVNYSISQSVSHTFLRICQIYVCDVRISFRGLLSDLVPMCVTLIPCVWMSGICLVYVWVFLHETVRLRDGHMISVGVWLCEFGFLWDWLCVSCDGGCVWLICFWYTFRIRSEWQEWHHLNI